jgi:hypothetical protein
LLPFPSSFFGSRLAMVEEEETCCVSPHLKSQLVADFQSLLPTRTDTNDGLRPTAPTTCSTRMLHGTPSSPN